MELLKKLLGILLDLLKKGLDLLRGKGLGEIAKKLGLALGGLFLLICTGKSLHALHRARRKAREIKKAVRRAEEVRQKGLFAPPVLTSRPIPGPRRAAAGQGRAPGRGAMTVMTVMTSKKCPGSQKPVIRHGSLFINKLKIVLYK